MNDDEWDQMTGWTQDQADAAYLAAAVWPCCKHCVDDQPHIKADTHEVPCNAPDPCPMGPIELERSRDS